MTFDTLDTTRFEDDSALLQQAVRLAHEAGETLVIPPRNPRTGENLWVLPRAVRLPSHSSILMDGCHIRHADNTFDNLFKNENARTPAGNTLEGRQTDISIIGRGHALLDGGLHNGLTERTHNKMGMPCFVNSAIHFCNVERFELSGFTVTEPRYWGVTFHFCAEGSVHDIRFACSGHSPNQDGIDLRRGCRDISICNITGFTGDDVVALTNLPGPSDMSCDVPGLCSDICRVIIRDLECGTSDERGIVRLLCNNGMKVHDVLIDNLIDASTPDRYLRAGSAVRINENGYYREGMAEPAYGDMKNITVRNVNTRARIGVRMSCNAARVLIDNIQMREDGGTALLLGKGDFRHIRVRNLGYDDLTCPPDSDDNVTEGPQNKRQPSALPLEQRRICAVYFQNSTVSDMKIDGVCAGRNLTHVFGGSLTGQVLVRDAVCLNDAVPMTEKDNLISFVD